MSRTHVRPLAAAGVKPNLEHFARPGIDKPFASEGPVLAGRRVERLPLVAAGSEQKPDQNERRRDRDPEEGHKCADHGAGSITAAVP